jgi:hypothetical protein
VLPFTNAALMCGQASGGGAEPPWTGAPGYIGHGTQIVVDSATSLDVPYPAGIQYHDILILQAYSIRTAAGTASVSAPAGWNVISSGVSRSDGLQAGGSFWLRADGTESGTVNVTTSSNFNRGGVISIVRGCVATGTPYEALSSVFGTSTTPTGSSVTTTGPNRLVTNLIGRAGGSATATVNPAAGWTEEFEVSATNSGGTQLIDFVWHDRVAASATTIAAEATTSSNNANWRIDSLAFLPR